MTLALLLLETTLLSGCYVAGQMTLTTNKPHLPLADSEQGKKVSLIGSSIASEGNVHIGNLPVCDDDWDLVDANVTCRMLGFAGATRRTFGSEFGNVPENFLMSHVNCSGQEDSLLECPHQDGEDCGSCMAAGVVCEPEYKPELRGGSGIHNGNLFFGNKPVCDDDWDMKDAIVACIMLGFHGAERASKSSEFGAVPENFMMGNIGCLGNESSIKDCLHNDGGSCRASDGAGVVCLDTIGYSTSLKEGKAAHRGHVFIGNFPVCSDGWDLQDATVACRMLGYAGAEESFEHDLDCDRTSNSPMITDVGCSGLEHSLQTCPHVVNDNCEGGRAGVICYPADSILNITLSYIEKASPHGSGEGNVFLYNQPICDDAWDNNDAKVACKMLGYSGGTATIRSNYGKVPEKFFKVHFNCFGNETTLMDCPHQKGSDCLEHEGAGVTCSTTGLPTLRLVGGTTTPGAASGNVYLGNSPVCASGWDMKTANETCRMLGYSGASKMSHHSLFGEVPTSSMVYDITCRGDEWSLAACSYKEDGGCPALDGSPLPKGAGVVCQGYRVELRGGSTSREGDLYITNQPVFQLGWGTEDAKVTCRMLGFSGVERATTGSTFVGQPYYTRYKAYNFQCSGSESNLGDCSHSLNYYSSGHSHGLWYGGNGGAGVVCSY